MAKKLKEYYDKDYLECISKKIYDVDQLFNREKFLELTNAKIDKLEFLDRQTLVAESLHETFEIDYPAVIKNFYQILGPELRGNSGAFSEGWWLWPIGRYVELYGSAYYDESIAFSKELTKRFTSEYCMRPLILKRPEQTLETLKSWSQDENERVRRLVSECMRIRLPWAKRMNIALKYFDDFIEVLDNLKNDSDKYIQKSVANNLNDLYKEDPEKFYYIVEKWETSDITKQTKWIIKHGSRTKDKELSNEGRN